MIALGNKRIDIKRKIVDGVEYGLSDVIDGQELWMPTDGMILREDEKPKCSKCGYDGVALDKHHIHGRKNSDETVILCANCHREYHRENGYHL
jgi:transposase-like protein